MQPFSSGTPLSPGHSAAALVDARGKIIWWSRAAAALVGWSDEEVRGTRARSLLVTPLAGRAPSSGSTARVQLRHRSGDRVDAAVTVIAGAGRSGYLVLADASAAAAGDGAKAPDSGRDLFTQEQIAVAEFDAALRLIKANQLFSDLGAECKDVNGVSGTIGPDDSTVGETLAGVVRGGSPLVAAGFRIPSDPDRLLSLVCFPVNSSHGKAAGVVVAAVESSPADRTGQLVETYRRAFEIGGSLDVVGAARDLVDVLVPAVADMGCVDFPDDVLQGTDPPLGYPGVEASHARRVAVKSDDGPWPAAMVHAGQKVPVVPDQDANAAIAVGGAFVVTPALGRQLLLDDPALIAQLMPPGMREAVVCPLYHRGRLFGSALLWRTRNLRPFTEGNVKLVQDLCDRTALAIDNAFHYTRERRTAIALQQSLLPPAATQSSACETAGTYLPADGTASAGGDWYDTIALSSLRTALVVGDVIGHGLTATATMARLRAAVHTLADLDLPPDELLTRLDDLVQRMAAESENPDTVGASCLFALHDPVTRRLQVASAGNPPLAVVRPDGSAAFLPLVPGPPLGVGDHPFEVWTETLPAGSLLALYTDGLTGRNPEAGMAALLTHLTEVHRSGAPLEEIGAELVGRRPGAAEQPDDDVTLLLARTRAVAAPDTRRWEYPADPSAVQRAREDVTTQLRTWGLEEQSFATELIASELVTNALRYAGPPIGLRLIRNDRTLVCEVSDPSSTQPRLRRALTTDEGGRGLFLIAQLTTRWGSRYGARGKTIWTEQDLPAT
ncbi:SpoIIE family protein phosphatase [Streptomyces sp. MBT58]|uniref:ATP-binding SpoIIE family protein phosphatase n=1 Tax=Streptomyces sp. MBT58 TaxID=1488389 RepID=UPI001913A109|nr:SpoIIE family protein phosphatase [Streptomyces sp. MBT58]MBK5994983.1 SpoIIE family protein phosphatase [Streptomyces sp. MBT58]